MASFLLLSAFAACMHSSAESDDKLSHFLGQNIVIEASSDKFQTIVVSLSLFENLFSMDNGGAIKIDSPLANASVQFSLFRVCESTNAGGGIYVKADTLSVLMCAFHGCVVQNKAYCGQSMFTDLHYLHSCQNSVAFSAPNSSLNGNEVVVHRGGIQKIIYHNSSNNVATHFACGLMTGESTLFMMSLSSFTNSTSPNHVFAIVHLRPDDTMTSCLFMSNHIRHDGVIFFSGCFAVVQKFVFAKNKGKILCFSPAFGQPFLILESCISDSPLSEIDSKKNCAAAFNAMFDESSPETPVFPTIYRSSDLPNFTRYAVVG